MRVTRGILEKVTHDTIKRRVREDHSLMAVYLCGSFLVEEYMLGGTGDVDLVFIHSESVPEEREIQRLTDEFHLDIAHHQHKDYRKTREVRMHPWWGPTLTVCQVLYDPQHFMDFTQASVRGQFDRPDRVLERAHLLVDQARQIWMDLAMNPPTPGPREIKQYLGAVEYAVNAIASVHGLPLTERRFLLDFPERAQAVGQPGLYAGLLGLLGAPKLVPDSLAGWVQMWQLAYEALPPQNRPVRLHPDRRLYYQAAFDAFLVSEQPQAALWPLLRTWTMAIAALPENAPVRGAWAQAFQQLGMLGVTFVNRLEALDAYLDLVEETLEVWAHRNGVLDSYADGRRRWSRLAP